jgi:riboflavin kinase/FMN adenylyltransferase
VDIIHYPDGVRPDDWKSPALALGNFDGLHRGHLALLEQVRRSAQERSVTPVALTFDPHPMRVVKPDRAPRLLMTEGQKLAGLERAGMQGVAIVRFTSEVAQWAPEVFVQRVLAEWLHVSDVWVGATFLFGHNRAGDYALLQALGPRLGFRADKIDPVRYENEVVSSSRIRLLVSEGRVDEAAGLLGRHYDIEGEVVTGDGRGRVLGFPTANIRTPNELVPRQGVYATVARIGADPTPYPSVTNIGDRPTFGAGHGESIETHLLAGGRTLYGELLRVAFVRRLREERKFASVEDLVAQIEVDCRDARAWLDPVVGPIFRSGEQA